MSKTKKPFKELLGNRIIIENFAEPAEEPKKEGSAPEIILLPDDQKSLDEEKMDKAVAETQRFTILQVGDDCNKKFQAGQEVYIEKPERVLAPGQAEILYEDGKILAFIIPERSIAGIF